MRCIGKRWPQRLAAAATVAALLAYVLFCTNVHYDLGDDVLLARSFGGMVGGVFESFNYITHTFLGWLMHGLSLLWPGVAWFSVAQVAVLWISAYAAVLSAMRAAQRLMLPAWCGWLAAVAYLLGLAAEGLTSVTYTLTAAAAGGAAVWRLMAQYIDILIKVCYYSIHRKNIGVSPSGKASDSDSDIPVFESQYPNHKATS